MSQCKLNLNTEWSSTIVATRKFKMSLLKFNNLHYLKINSCNTPFCRGSAPTAAVAPRWRRRTRRWCLTFDLIKSLPLANRPLPHLAHKRIIFWIFMMNILLHVCIIRWSTRKAGATAKWGIPHILYSWISGIIATPLKKVRTSTLYTALNGNPSSNHQSTF